MSGLCSTTIKLSNTGINNKTGGIENVWNWVLKAVMNIQYIGKTKKALITITREYISALINRLLFNLSLTLFWLSQS